MAETQPYTLVGGPLDGLAIDSEQERDEIWPNIHHLKSFDCKRKVRYVKRNDGKFHFDGILRPPLTGQEQ